MPLGAPVRLAAGTNFTINTTSFVHNKFAACWPAQLETKNIGSIFTYLYICTCDALFKIYKITYFQANNSAARGKFCEHCCVWIQNKAGRRCWSEPRSTNVSCQTVTFSKYYNRGEISRLFELTTTSPYNSG